MFSITLIFKEYYHVVFEISYAIGLLSAYLYKFYFNMKLTFIAVGHTVLRLERFAVVGFLIFFLSWSGAVFLVNILKANYIFAIILTQLILALLNFRLENVWVFAKIPQREHRLI